MDFMVEKSVDWCAKYKVLINSIYLKYYEKKITIIRNGIVFNDYQL